jgi:hypothetical protein
MKNAGNGIKVAWWVESDRMDVGVQEGVLGQGVSGVREDV